MVSWHLCKQKQFDISKLLQIKRHGKLPLKVGVAIAFRECSTSRHLMKPKRKGKLENEDEDGMVEPRPRSRGRPEKFQLRDATPKKQRDFLGIFLKCRTPPTPLLGTPVSKKKSMVYFAFWVLWSIFGLHQNVHFLATLVALHFTPVSKSVSDS